MTCDDVYDDTAALFDASLQADSCVIEEQCYGPGEESSDDRCLVCRPTRSRTEFSINKGLYVALHSAFQSDPARSDALNGDASLSMATP